MFLWCGQEDSNLHGLPHCHLKAARLPIPPRPQKCGMTPVPRRRNGEGLTNQFWGYKTERKAPKSAHLLLAGQQFLDLDGDPVA